MLYPKEETFKSKFIHTMRLKEKLNHLMTVLFVKESFKEYKIVETLVHINIS